MEHFPGIVIDEQHSRIYVDEKKFFDDLPDYFEKENSSEYFRISDKYSHVYRHFVSMDLSGYKAIRGQIISPISLSLKIVDENGMPIVYNDDMRTLAFSFIQKKLNVQYSELKEKNENAFVWIDDPGLEFIFNALCGYDTKKAWNELIDFYNGINGLHGLHLCGRPDWDFLLSLDIHLLSFNAYAFGDLFVTYEKVKNFIEKNNIISWGIVPTTNEEFGKEDVEALAKKLEGMWHVLETKGIDREMIVHNSLLAPATCNLVNVDKTLTVENSLRLLKQLAEFLKEKYLKN